MKIEIDMGSKEMQGVLAAVAAATAEILAPRLAALEAALLKAIQEQRGNTQAKQTEAGNPRETAVLSKKDVSALTGLAETTLWRLEKKGDFPAKVSLSPGRTGWVRDEILAWIESRKAA
jgi:predicted DNA-binding transcriptional regulator AlpA